MTQELGTCIILGLDIGNFTMNAALRFHQQPVISKASTRTRTHTTLPTLIDIKTIKKDVYLDYDKVWNYQYNTKM